MDSMGVASTTLLPYSPMPSEIAPALRPPHRIGEPEKPGPTPVESTAGPETRMRMRGPPAAGSSAITSITSTLKLAIAVPRTTDRPVHCIPGRTSLSGMVGSAPCAAGVATAKLRRTTEAARRIKERGEYLALQKCNGFAEEQVGTNT
jgi:hypothetical protein